ncbi:Glycosyltransferase [Quillaja saponaria]|uniref:Glycosyltransferase n=1 Tax=Quillaja saponaria TaxID=32244 RepID=A0AAD7PGC7_QUISA|nr:Glycosyltransferase [Quillaja saponaria]
MSDSVVHVALFPSAGIGHLNPFLRFAALLVQRHCQVTLITPLPTVSLAESELISRFCSAFPQVNQIQFHLLPVDDATVNSTDPFWLRFEAIRRSAHLLSPLLASLSPPLSAVVSDISLFSSLVPITDSLCLATYILTPSSSKMFSFFSYFPNLLASRKSIPPLLCVPNSLFENIFKEDSPKITKLNGVLLNTFEVAEAQTLEALNGVKVVKGLPPVFSLGPFVPCEFEGRDQLGAILTKWLDDQPAGSVVYVGFGSRTALTRNQIREIGDGLMKSGHKFFWVVKDKLVDRDDEEGLDEVLGHELMESMKKQGLVVKTFVDQAAILGHKAVGGFVSHCGWNSVMEAAYHGVPILAWPLHGDQMINAEVVETIGLGMWVRSWGWVGETVVKGAQIEEAIKEMMGNESLRLKAAELKEAGRKAIGIGGSSEVTLNRLIDEWKKKNRST